ncbi:MAG: YciI family protein, partial [Gemmatimonadales bacterium]
MKYVCLVYSDEKDLKVLSDAECLDLSEDLKATGHRLAAEALQPVTTARTVRVRNGKAATTDGPFA